MLKSSLVIACLGLVLGCSRTPNYDDGSGSSHSGFHSSRLKIPPNLPSVFQTPDPAKGIDSAFAEGVWTPISKNAKPSSSDNLAFPEQAKIMCYLRGKYCHVQTVTLSASPGMVSIVDLDEEDIPVQTWTTDELSGERAAWKFGNLSDKCRSRTLTINFKAKTVFESDVTTQHTKECQGLSDVDTYKLTGGSYFIDTTFKNSLGGETP